MAICTDVSIEPSKKLAELMRRAIPDAPSPCAQALPVITSICIDSRQAVPGAMFVAISGAKADGAGFVADAIQRGAVAIVADRPIEVPATVCLIQVVNARSAASRLAADFYGLTDIQARGGLRAIGITGTNGKSTTAYMIRRILQEAGRKTALLGTIEYDLLSRKIGAELTTPDPISLVRHLVDAHEAGAQDFVMEVSSHSLDQRRIDGIRFSSALFTNLTQDHLDYHRTIDAYRQAKARLFQSLPSNAAAIVNADDPSCMAMVDGCAASVLRFGMDSTADLAGEIISMTREGSTFRARYKGQADELHTPLVGRHNVSNALAAAATALSLGIDRPSIRVGLAELSHVPGRLQRLETGERGYDIFVDYAHTDDALRNVLTALRPLTPERLSCVFGCGGDRDRGKRPLMARAVAELADDFVITSDNPRTEDPLRIIDDIRKGLSKDECRLAQVEPDRRLAIDLAVSRLSPCDTLLIAGKGHEDYQILGTRKVHFDDVEIAQTAINRS